MTSFYDDTFDKAQYHLNKAQHDFEEDQRYEMERPCYGCDRPFPRIELTNVREDEEYCKTCFEKLEVKAQMAHKAQKEDRDD